MSQRVVLFVLPALNFMPFSRRKTTLCLLYARSEVLACTALAYKPMYALQTNTHDTVADAKYVCHQL